MVRREATRKGQMERGVEFGGGARQRVVRGEIYWCLWTHQLLGGGKTVADTLRCVLSARRAQGRRGGQANKRRSELKKKSVTGGLF